MPKTCVPVKKTNLMKAAQAMQKHATRIGEDGVIAVCVELGLDPYLEVDDDSHFQFKELTDLQIVALAAAMAAFEMPEEQVQEMPDW